MGAQASSNVSNIENKLINSSYQQCPKVNVSETVNINDVTFSPLPTCTVAYYFIKEGGVKTVADATEKGAVVGAGPIFEWINIGRQNVYLILIVVILIVVALFLVASKKKDETITNKDVGDLKQTIQEAHQVAALRPEYIDTIYPPEYTLTNAHQPSDRIDVTRDRYGDDMLTSTGSFYGTSDPSSDFDYTSSCASPLMSPL